jgi:hypothetical protein
MTLQNIPMFYVFLVIPDKYQCTIYVIENHVFWLKSIKSSYYQITQNSIKGIEQAGSRSKAYGGYTGVPDLNLGQCSDYIEVFFTFFNHLRRIEE